MASQEQSVEQLFSAALDQRPEDRSAFLDRACAGAPELRRRVEELLLADEEAGSFLEEPLIKTLADQGAETVPTEGINDARVMPGGFNAAGRFDPGQVIADRFTVIRFIAHGGMGEVYEVEDRFLQGVHIALKVILPHIAGDAGSSRRFEQEVLLARKVTHPNLCPIYDISRCQEPAPPFVFLTMKLLTGETLASRLKRPASIPRSEIISIFRQMIAGLGAIHDGGIVHRDIKPNNVMLDYSGAEICVSIMDFGLARLYDSQTTITVGLIAGTPGYIAPELLRGDPPSQATDIFALGVLFQQVLTNRCLSEEVHGLSVKPSPALDGADVPSAYIHSVKEFLSEDPKRRCDAFRQMRTAFDSGNAITTRTSIEVSQGPSRLLTRRNFALGSAVAACAAASGIVWKWDSVRDRFDDFAHPLPLKRFVALLNWPSTTDARIKPMLAGVIEAIGAELARAEAFDRDLYVISESIDAEPKTTAQINNIRDRSGANLVLATSGAMSSDQFNLSLRVLDTSSTRALREKQIHLPLEERMTFSSKAVRAAAELLDVRHYTHNDRRTSPDTQSPEAYAYFQEAAALMKQDNDTGLNAAIDKYKEALELDPRYATAYAKLALAYFRLYGMQRDPAAISLARSNCEKALTLRPDLVEAHLALSSVLEYTGDKDGASREFERALAIDPADPRTLLAQGQFFTRLNRWAESEATFDRVLKLRPNYWVAHNELGYVFGAQGKYPQSMAEYRTASLAAPKNAMAVNNIADVYLRQGKLKEAEEAAAKSLALHQNDLASITMASALRSEGKYSDAVQFAQKAVDLNPSQSVGWLELGDCLSLIRGRHSDAQKAYSHAADSLEEELQTDPTDGPGLMMLALCKVKLGTPEKALSLIDQAEQSPADDVDSQLIKARTLELLGDHDGALATIASCLKRGVTLFEIQTMPDMESLRNDRRYNQLAKSSDSAI